MAFSEYLADRIRQELQENSVQYNERKMMGGLCFMVNDKMCVGIIQESLMVRIDPLGYEDALKKEGCRVMDFTGKPMKGFLFVDPIGIDSDEMLSYWIQRCLEYNPLAKSSKKKK